MNWEFDLQFFGGGGTTVTQANKRDPMNPLYEQAQTTMFNDLYPFYQQTLANKQGFQNAYDIGQQAVKSMGGLMDRVPGMMRAQDRTYANWQNALNTGAIPTQLYNNMYGSIQRGLLESMGNAVNSYGNRGVLNSSVTNRAFDTMGQNAADAMQSGYLNTWNNLLGGYQNLYNSGNSALANLYSGMGSLSGVPAAAMNAYLAPAKPFYDLTQDYARNYYGHEDYDTAVTQGK